jgi:hypothetical protein
MVKRQLAFSGSRELIRYSMISAFHRAYRGVLKRKRPLGYTCRVSALYPFASGLVTNDESEERTDAIGPNAWTVILLPSIATVRVVVIILSASFHLVAVIATVEVISSVIVPAKVRRLIVAIPTASLRGNRQSHRSHQHQSH